VRRRAFITSVSGAHPPLGGGRCVWYRYELLRTDQLNKLQDKTQNGLSCLINSATVPGCCAMSLHLGDLSSSLTALWLVENQAGGNATTTEWRQSVVACDSWAAWRLLPESCTSCHAPRLARSQFNAETGFQKGKLAPEGVKEWRAPNPLSYYML